MSQAISSIPAHVPENLVFDFDYYDLESFSRDPHRALLVLQEKPDIVYTPRRGGHWIATRADVISDIMHKPELFSNWPCALPLSEAFPIKLTPIDTDPPIQTAYRRALAPVFAPRAMEGLEDDIRRTARELIDGLYANGKCEFVSEFAHHLPIDVFLRLMDLPLEHRAMFLAWTNEVTHGSDPEKRAEAQGATLNYLKDAIEARRKAPGTDIISRLLASSVEDRLLTAEEVLGMSTVIFFGGLDTVTATISFITWFLAEHPDHRQQLLDEPSLIRNAAEELMRRRTIVNTPRRATHDFEFRGVQFKTDEQILLPLSLYGLDDRQNEDPLTVDFRRSVIHHAHFSIGPHRCPGSHLARIEIRVFMEEWLRRIPHFTVTPGEEVVTVGGSILGVASLPVSWPVQP